MRVRFIDADGTIRAEEVRMRKRSMPTIWIRPVLAQSGEALDSFEALAKSKRMTAIVEYTEERFLRQEIVVPDPDSMQSVTEYFYIAEGVSLSEAEVIARNDIRKRFQWDGPERLNFEPWYLVVYACEGCGGESAVYGPFADAAAACRHDDPFGWCATRQVVRMEAPTPEPEAK